MGASNRRAPESRVVYMATLGKKGGVRLALAGVIELFFTSD